MRKLFVWSISRCFVDAHDRPASNGDIRPPERALVFVADYDEETVFLFKDFHPYLKDSSPGAPLLIRQLRDLVPEMKDPQRTLLCAVNGAANSARAAKGRDGGGLAFADRKRIPAGSGAGNDTSAGQPDADR